jgi:hypothetical protein
MRLIDNDSFFDDLEEFELAENIGTSYKEDVNTLDWLINVTEMRARKQGMIHSYINFERYNICPNTFK